MAIIPGERKMLSNVWLEMDNQLSNYVRGKSIEILIVAVASAIIFASFEFLITFKFVTLLVFTILNLLYCNIIVCEYANFRRNFNRFSSDLFCFHISFN